MAEEPITTLLEMTERPALNVTRPHRGGMLLRLEEPSTDFYRFLLRSIGASEEGDRLALADEALFELLGDPLLEVFVLFLGGAPAGCFELDRRMVAEVELVRFGLLPGFRGRGLAKYLLATAVETAWDEEPMRVWVQAAAGKASRSLLLYQWAGFAPIQTDSADL